MAERYSVSDINGLKGRGVFVDANVLIYLYGSYPRNDNQYNYSKIYSNLLKHRVPLFIDFNVISELLNRLLRIEYVNYTESNQIKIDYKPFRNSKDGKEISSQIYEIVKSKILAKYGIIGKKYIFDEIISFLVPDNLDFNDKAIENICKENKLILLTNDADFAQSDVDILTCNLKILNNCN